MFDFATQYDGAQERARESFENPPSDADFEAAHREADEADELDQFGRSTALPARRAMDQGRNISANWGRRASVNIETTEH